MFLFLNYPLTDDTQHLSCKIFKLLECLFDTNFFLFKKQGQCDTISYHTKPHPLIQFITQLLDKRLEEHHQVLLNRNIEITNTKATYYLELF